MTKTLIIGTVNKAKINQIKGVLQGLDIIVKMADDLPDVIEDGETAIENARKKATTYAKFLGCPVLSMDNSLYLDKIPDHLQPGIHVRRINRQSDRPSDEDLIVHYSSLIAQYGGRLSGYWRFGLCIAKPSGEYREGIIESPRIFTSIPCSARLPGYPLESLQIDKETNKYIAELSGPERADFWVRTLGVETAKFVKDSFDLLL